MLRLESDWVWDFWFADDGEDFHLFFLFAPKSLGDPELRHRNAQIGHAISSDLRTWDVLRPALGPGVGFDATATWTGSVVRAQDGSWRMYYTGSLFLGPWPDGRNIETVGVATSTDLERWIKQPGPVVEADSRWYERFGTSSWREEAWRDPWVFADPSGTGWHMLITARSNRGSDDNRGVVGHAFSADLETWAVLPPLTDSESGFGHIEVPQVIDYDSRWFLLFSCDTGTLSEERQRAGDRGGIWAVEIADPTQPFDIRSAYLLSNDLYSGRAIRDRNGKWTLLAFVSGAPDDDFPGIITDPMPLMLNERGRLDVGPPAAIAAR